MTDSPALTVVSGSALYQAVLDSGGWSHRPKISRKLAKMGDRTRAMETTALRVPAFGTSASGQLPLPFDEPVRVYGYPVMVGGEARARDLPLVIGWASRFILDGCPEDCIVEWTLAEGADWLAYRSYGGREAARVRQAVRRIKTVAMEDVIVRLGPGDEMPLDHGYGFLSQYWIPRGQGKGRAWVELDKNFAALLRLGRVTFLDNPIIRQLQTTDEVALRVWLFLETESGPTRPGGYPYPVFPEPNASMPSISQMTWLSGERRKVVARLRDAIKVLCAADPRYSVTITRKAQMIAIRGVAGEVDERGQSAPDNGRTRALGMDGRGHMEWTRAGTSALAHNVGNVEDVEEPSSRGMNPILEALRSSGWKRPSKPQVQLVLDLFRERHITDEDTIANLISEQYPGPAVDLVKWCKAVQPPSRPIRNIADIVEPPPLTSCESPDCERVSVTYERPFLCADCEVAA